MTSKQIYEATAIELSKVQAPALKLYEFNYFFNLAIHLFVNKVYNVYDVNQQTTDDLRVLKATATLKPELAKSTGNKAIDYLRGATYFVNMPNDYLHLLNCICLFDVKKLKECWNEGDVMVVGATKLTADSWSSVIDDVYNRPTKKRPYYYIHNQNDIYVDASTYKVTDRNSKLPTNINNTIATVSSGNATDKHHTLSYNIWMNMLNAAEDAANVENATKQDVYDAAVDAIGDDNLIKTELDKIIKNTKITNAELMLAAIKDLDPSVILTSNSNFSRTFHYDLDYDKEDSGETFSTIEKPAGSRYANTSSVKVEIRCGRDTSNVFSLSAVQIDYLKAPQFIRLTQEQLDSDEDISLIMEFPDYVNQEIINELVNLVMRKINDPSLNTHILITESIARPTGQLQQ